VDRGAFYVLISAYLALALPYFANGDASEQPANFHAFMVGCAWGALLTIAVSALLLPGWIGTPGFSPAASDAGSGYAPSSLPR
jgi:hypothetical protein